MTAEDLQEYVGIIDRMKSLLNSADFDQVFSLLTSDIPKSRQFLLKMELKRMAQPCNYFIDLRGHVDGDVKPYEYKGKTHYMDNNAIKVFETLDILEARLKQQRFLFGANQTEADWRLFTTLVRFDAVYVGHFKCNIRRIADYPNVSGYLRDLYQTPGVAETVDMRHIKEHYYLSHTMINPTGIVPVGPAINLEMAHNRQALV